MRAIVRSHRLNPLPHAGTISVFLLMLVVASGIYITLFYGFGDDAAYESVGRMVDHPIQSVVRTVHRYSSAALVATTVVHSWRIMVAGRFRGPRRWVWVSGVAALSLVLLAGVTGYWLVRDARSQAIDDAVLNLLGGVGAVSAFYVRGLSGPSAGSGWGAVFAVWTAHLLITVTIGWFMWRHLRRSQLPWLPPRHWAITMGAALIIVAIALPADVLPAADLARSAVDLPLDPFVLFLLPPLLSGWAWPAALGLAVVLVAVAVAPLGARRPPVVIVDASRCTGCELCVIDCPYRAITMVDRVTADEVAGTRPDRSLATIDDDACVGCGICVGSCAFGALTLPGFENDAEIDVADRHVVLACQRHRERSDDIPETDPNGLPVQLISVSCTGMIAPHTMGRLLADGAREVQVVGCAPGDCTYGWGNTVVDERIRGERAPHLARRWSGRVERDWVSPGELVAAIGASHHHEHADGRHWVRRSRWPVAAAVVLASVLGIAVATRAQYAGSDRAGVTVMVDHVPGATLDGYLPPPAGSLAASQIVITVDGVEQSRTTPPTSQGAAVGIVTSQFEPGVRAVRVELVEGDVSTRLYEGAREFEPSERLSLVAVDAPPTPGVDEGRALFESRAAGCSICHSVRPGDDGVGPSLAGVADRAVSRVPGVEAREYLWTSIVDPDAYIVDGFRSGQMLDIYDTTLSQADIDALVSYLLTLRGEE